MKSYFAWSVTSFVAALAASSSLAPVAHAQQEGLKVAVLRGTTGEVGSLAAEVDGALLRDLATLAGIDNPTVVPVDYAEIQLTVGCADESPACLRSIADTVSVNSLIVRKLSAVPGGDVSLTLIYYDTSSSDEPSQAQATAAAGQAPTALVEAVPSLVRKLFGIPEPVVAAAGPTAEPAAAQGPADAATGSTELQAESAAVGPLTWVSLAAGAAILAAGLVVGLGANSSFDDFKALEIEDEAAARRASDEFDSIESQALMANILVPAGIVVLGVGATLLWLDLSGGSGEVAAQAGVTPLAGGAMVLVQGSFGGRR